MTFVWQIVEPGDTEKKVGEREFATYKAYQFSPYGWCEEGMSENLQDQSSFRARLVLRFRVDYSYVPSQRPRKEKIIELVN